MKKLLPLLLGMTLTACAGQAEQVPASTDFQPDERPLGKTLVYECTGIEFITRLGPGEMALWLEDRYLILSQVRAASGTKYQEGDIVFWSKGDQVTLELDGVRYADCRLNPARAPWEDARRRGVEFRAVGNEPGWYLEVRGEQHLLFVGDYGSSRHLFTELTATEEGDELHYRGRSASESIAVTVSETFCADSMKGEEFPYTVTVQLNNRIFSGCGRALDYPWN